MNNYVAGLYIRLSKEDCNKKNTNSESIENQMNLLKKYSLENNYEIYDCYIDDGYSGTNFNRPSFNRLINDIEKKKINMVIVKDLSRLGRDYILTGYYIEMWFPKHNIRFISILDNIDSLNNYNELMPFKSVINDMYSRDNSKKIKASLRIKQQLGKWVGGCTPFGYMQDPLDKNHLIINEQEAIIVKKIFKLFLLDYSINKISNYLYDNKILTPTCYRKINRLTKYSKDGYWSTTTIKSILINQLYTGDLVQNRRSRVNYKIKKLKNNDLNEWIIIPNTHEPIITKKDFLIVQNKLSNRCISKPNSSLLLSGIIKCFECKKSITFQKNRNNIYTVCNTYKKYSKLKLCTSHSNNYYEIEKEIINVLKNILSKNDKYKNIKYNRDVVMTLIKKIEIHNDKTIDVFLNFKKPCFIS